MAQGILTVKPVSEGVDERKLTALSFVDGFEDQTDTKGMMGSYIVKTPPRRTPAFKNAAAGPSNRPPIHKCAFSPNSNDDENDITYMNPPKTKKVKTEVIDLSDDDY